MNFKIAGDRSVQTPIKWQRTYRDGFNEYEATVDGIKFFIWHALNGTRHNFGLTARRLSDNKQLHGSHTIAWRSTKKRCIKYAEEILAAQRLVNHQSSDAEPQDGVVP